MIRIDVEVVAMSDANYFAATTRVVRKKTIEVPMEYDNDVAWSITESILATVEKIKEEMIGADIKEA